MLGLDESLRAWGTPAFGATFKHEIARQPEQLPLQQGLSGSSSVAAEPVTAIILATAETDSSLRVKAGIFYRGVIGGCSCADDPSPDNTVNEYCEVWVEIDKAGAATKVELLDGTD